MIRIKKGLDLPIQGAAECRISDACGVSTFAVKPTDYVGLVPRLLVAEGFVFAPDKKKRPIMRQLEAALQTLTFDGKK